MTRDVTYATTIEEPRLVTWFAGWRIADRLAAFDRDPRVIGAGALVGVVIAILMAGNLDKQLPGLAVAVVALALLAPSAGVATLATLAVFREPAGFEPIGFTVTVIGACAMAAAFRVGLALLEGRTMTVRAEFVAIAAYVGLSTFQFLWITSKVSHAREQFAMEDLTQMAGGLLLVVVVAVVFSAQSRRWLIAAMVPGLVLAALVAIISLEPTWIAKLPISGWLPIVDISARGTGFFRNPNFLGQAMAMGFLLVGRGRRLRLPGILSSWSLPLGGVVALAAVASFSRGALLASVSGVLVLFARHGGRVLAAAAAVGAVVVVVGYQALLAVRHLIIFGADVDASAIAQALSDDARFAVYRAGLVMLASHPLFGVGYGQFHFVSAKYLESQKVTYSHDIFLGIGAEQGLPGLLTFVAVLATIGYALYRRRDDVSVTAAAMFAAFVVGSFLADNLTSLQTIAIMWLAVGCALAAPEAAPALAAPVAAPAAPGWSSLRSPGARLRDGPLEQR